MNISTSQKAARQQRVAQMQRLVESLEAVEPKMLDVASDLLAKNLFDVFPRLRAAVVETGNLVVPITFTLSFDFTQKKPSVTLETNLQPQPFRNTEQAIIFTP